MEVIKQFPENMDKRTSYKLMNSNEVQKMSDAEGSILETKAWIIFMDEDSKNGEPKKVIAILTEDDEIFGTISETFIREFEKMVDHFGSEIGAIKVVGGKSKAGRNFITCDIA